MDTMETTGGGGGRNPSETQSRMLPPRSAHHSSQSHPPNWLMLTWGGLRAEVLFVTVWGVSQHFPPNQSPSCSAVGVGIREELSSSLSIIPPALNVVISNIIGRARPEPQAAASPGPFPWSDPVHVSFSLSICVFQNTTFVLSLCSL